MICIGYKMEEKLDSILDYISRHKIEKVYIFRPVHLAFDYVLGVPVEFINYDDIIMYKFFYRLLAEIDENSLIIMDECLRTQNRGDLVYNCAHHYLNQTTHRLIFEFFPFIEDESDFMILLDFEDKNQFRQLGFNKFLLNQIDTKIRKNTIEFLTLPVELPSDAATAYESRRDFLFENIGNKHPDTIPQNLHIWVGRYKKPALLKSDIYVARNKRFNRPNIATYKTASEARTIIDFPIKQITLNDFIKKNGVGTVKFLTTGLSIDRYYETKFSTWLEKLERFYDETGI